MAQKKAQKKIHNNNNGRNEISNAMQEGNDIITENLVIIIGRIFTDTRYNWSK